MRTSGLVLDIHDDFGGSQLKSFFPDISSVPNFLKTAQSLSSEDIRSLPDDAFALVMVNGEDKLRKYACIDEGNTALSVLYFVKNASKLPPEARKVTAENLKIACGWYGLDVPEELEKEAGILGAIGRGAVSTAKNVKGAGGALLGVASAPVAAVTAPFKAVGNAASFVKDPLRHAAKNPVGTAMTALTAPALVRGTKQGIQENLARVRAGEAMGGAIGGMGAMTGHGGMTHLASANLDHLKFAMAMKGSELSGTDTMPYTPPSDRSVHTPAAGTIKKTSSIGRLVAGHKGDEQVSPEVGKPVMGKAPYKAPQHMNPVVVVTDSKVSREPTEKKASHYALPSMEKYPLDNYAQVKMAAAYFDDYGRHMSPEDRREYCYNLTKRASDLSIQLSDIVRKYGSEKYASAHEIDAALHTRRQLLNDSDSLGALSKIASVVAVVPPVEFASLLSNFDRLTGLSHHYDSYVMDPYYSTYGFEKSAEESDNWSDTIGNYHVTKRDLELLALNHLMLIKRVFGQDLSEEFREDPVGIYNSLPVDQKKLIIRMATENAI